MVRRQPVIEHENATHVAASDGANSLTNRQIQLADDRKDDHDEGCEETECLERIGKHQRANAATTGVEPDERHHHNDIHCEGNACRSEDKLLKDDADDIESDGCPRHLRQQEETGSRLVRSHAEPLAQIGVDAGEVQPIIKR